ncbi:MAG TPA: hypothetical protein VF173_24875 [Thermoanaerobaculia bacterium]|nr:hypothetical protein [Thermoanaerobaculia bacterium]
MARIVLLGIRDKPAIVLSFAGKVLRAVALAVLGVSLLAALPLTALRVGKRVYDATRLAGEDHRGARLRVLGAPAVEALEVIRRAVPPDGEYLLVDGGHEWQGATYWVRFELAPRKAWYVGRLEEMTAPSHAAWSLPPGPRWVVVALPHAPAVLLDRDDFLRRMEPLHGPG